MGDIYVNVGRMDVSAVPKEYAAKAKLALEGGITKAVKKTSGFSADKKGEGYSLDLKVSDLKVDEKGVDCKLQGILWRFPKAEMVSKSLNGSAHADGGKPENMVPDCIDSILEDLMKKVLVEMKKQTR